MEMASARSRPAARARQASDQIVAWAACVLVSALSLLLLVAVSSGFGAARLTGEISVLVRTTTAATTTSSSDAVDDVAVVAAAEHCDVVDGEWVRDDDDERRPLYEPRRCPFVDEGFRCRENGRPDDAFAKWRWQPRHCTLPRFSSPSNTKNSLAISSSMAKLTSCYSS